MGSFMKQLRPAIIIFLALTIVTGIVYPLIVTGVAELFFKDKANGSLLYIDGKPVGSALIGQQFDDPKYFWGRPSATAPAPYDSSSSAGSNLGPLNSHLIQNVKARIEALNDVDPENKKPVPVDLVTSSGSGLDPHISPAAAEYQLARVARVRGMKEEDARRLVQENTQKRFLGLLGEPVVEVLKLNIALDSIAGER
jgi:K+-transporting ATPase ATPase C chain